MPSERDGGSSGSGSLNNHRVISRRSEAGPLANNDVLSKTKHEEWTTSKKVVNHKTKQVETRVQRQIILEDGKVIADSGPQVTTKTTEDNKTEETENTEHKTSGDDEVDEGYVMVPGSARVVSEKTETHQTMKESKEESRKMHDESMKELTGPEIHHKALVAPSDFGRELDKPFTGKLTHFSSKSQKVTDKEEVKEISAQGRNGEMTTETTRTHHHEEVHDDEVPEDEAGQGALPDATGHIIRPRIEYRKDELDSLSEKLRREKELNLIRETLERRDAVTKKALSVEEEEEIRNCETNRWLEDHFGSDGSDIVETTRTKAGGNVINIQMTSIKKPPPKLESHGVHVAKRVSDLNAAASRKEIRFSTTREPDVVYTTIRTATPSSQPSRSMGSPNDNYSTLSSKSPIKTYYLGQDGTYGTRQSPPRYESTPLRKSSWKSTPALNEDRYVKTTETRFVRNDDSRRERSPVQRSMSQRDFSVLKPDSSLNRSTTRDDTVIHKISTQDYYRDEPDHTWKSIKTLPRDTKFKGKTNDRRHHKEYSEVQSFRFGNKTDRCVQVVLSDDEDDTTNRSTLSRRMSPSPIEHVIYARPSPRGTDSPRHSPGQSSLKPSKQFYFGEERPSSRLNGTTSEGYSSLPSSNRYSTLEREDSIDRRYSSYSPLDRSMGDSMDRYTSRNNRNHTESHTSKEKRYTSGRGNSSFDSGTYLHLDDYTNGKSAHTTSTGRRQYIDSLLTTVDDPYYSSRKPAAERRQRSFYTNVPPSPPQSPPISPPPRLIRADRFGGSSSLSPPDSPVAPPPPPPPPDHTLKGTWSKTRGRTTSPPMDPPRFTPLLSPVEIKNMANSFSSSRNQKYVDVKPNGKAGTVVQVRDWGNR